MHRIILLYLLTCFLSLVSADCKSFALSSNSTSNGFMVAGNDTIRVSAIVNCSSSAESGGRPANSDSNLQCNSTECHIATPPNILIRLNQTLSISTTESATNSILNLIRHQTTFSSSTNFDGPDLYTVTEVDECIELGKAGYWGFTPYYQCVDGILSQCSGDGYPVDGTFVRACGVLQIGSAENPKIANGILGTVFGTDFVDTPAPVNATLSLAQRTVNLNISHTWILLVGLALVFFTSL